MKDIKQCEEEYFHINKTVFKSLLFTLITAFISWGFLYMFWYGSRQELNSIPSIGTALLLAPFLVGNIILALSPVIVFFSDYNKKR